MTTKFTFDHVHLNSADRAKAVEFYEQVFGGKKLADLEIGDRKLSLMGFGSTTFIINDAKPKGVATGTSIDHIGFRMDDLAQAAQELKDKGIEFTMEPTEVRKGLKIAFVKGPDDVLIELLESKQ